MNILLTSIAQNLPKFLRFFTAIMICILAGIEIDIFIPSFPEIKQLFNVSPFLLQMLLSCNFIAYCISGLFIGTLGDTYSKRTLILGGLIIFILGSIFCVFTSSFYILLLGRTLQGAGIAAPAVLGYLIIADEYSLKSQQALMGVINGIITLSMSIAPIIGSHIAAEHGWRGNFSALLILGVFSFTICYMTLPASLKNNDTIVPVIISPMAYLPLLRSSKFMLYVAAICLSVLPYWVFVSMSSLLYIESMQVSLKSFGYFQGSLCCLFGILSLTSSILIKNFGERFCFKIGLGLCLATCAFIIIILNLDVKDPFIITAAMLLLAMAVIFPVNILYPLALEVVSQSKSKASALIMAIRLLSTSLILETVSLFYNGSFQPIGISICICLLLFIISIHFLLKKRWLILCVKPPVFANLSS